MLAGIKGMWKVSNIEDFVETFGCEKEFKEVTGKSIEEWDYEEYDDEVIEKILERIEGTYFFYFDEAEDCFYIFELEV